jgi:DNA-binding NarL/FixJ family response regulator
LRVGTETERGAQTNPTRRILIADDYALIRDGFKRMLGYEKDFEVIGEASDGREAVELCRRLEPDLVLMDVRMPEMDGLEATRAIKANQPEVSVLVITTYENADYLVEAIKVGAAGYVLKDASSERLVNSMRRVLAGESPLNQELAAQVIQRLAREGPQASAPLSAAEGEGGTEAASPLLEDFTSREVEVLGLVVRGKTNQEIASSLSISRATAKVHVRHIIAKLGVSDRTQAVVRALELGLAPYPKKTGP